VAPHDEPDGGNQSAVTTHRVQDAARYLEFEGVRLSEVSTETDAVPRWTDMALYRTDDGRYVLSIVGRSVVYHEHNGRCNSGIPTPVAEINDDLAEELEPCVKCNPEPLDEFTGLMVSLEEDRPAAYVCASADDVVTQLRNPKATGSRGTGQISGPGQRLLAIAAGVDEGIRNAVTVVNRI